MNREKAICMALKIVETCKAHNDNCTQCPFNIKGCIVTVDEPPTEWAVNEIFKFYERRFGEK